MDLYNVEVDIDDYEAVKKIADILFSKTPTNMPEKKARKLSVKHAVKFLGEFEDVINFVPVKKTKKNDSDSQTEGWINVIRSTQ